MKRALLLVGFLVMGCHNKEFKPVREVEAPASYPARTDWVVVKNPAGTPTQMPQPGFPPIFALDREPPNKTGDDALLWAEVQSRTILNPKNFKHLEADPRPLIANTLELLFGTPSQPRVGMSATQYEAHLDDLTTRLKAPGLKGEAKEALQDELKDWKKEKAYFDDLPKSWESLQLEPEQLAKGGALYRDYCQQCHGLTGDGNGPGGKYLTPLPRDYRSGLFKFYSTQPNTDGVKPQRADLHRTIRNGLDGSAMPAFAALKPDQIDAIVSYVMHLSIRGETEYRLLLIAADPKKADDFSVPTTPFEMLKHFKRSLSVWQRSNTTPVVIPPDPNTTPEEKLAAAARGHKRFLDPAQGSCTQCHVNFGRGGPLQYDSWAGILRPRNLTLPTFRVSRQPEDIYTRILCGIPGSNMPSHDKLLPTADEKAKGEDRIWDLVNFVRTISDPALRRQLREVYGVELE